LAWPLMNSPLQYGGMNLSVGAGRRRVQPVRRTVEK